MAAAFKSFEHAKTAGAVTVRTVSTFDRFAGAITSAQYVARTAILVPHALLRAWVYAQNVVLAGTMEIELRLQDQRGARGGGAASEKIENDELITRANVMSRWDFELLDFARGSAPAERAYFLSLLSTDAAARFDEPILVLEYEA